LPGDYPDGGILSTSIAHRTLISLTFRCTFLALRGRGLPNTRKFTAESEKKLPSNSIKLIIEAVNLYMSSLTKENLIRNYKRELSVREYSDRTISAYSRMLSQYLDYALKTPDVPREDRIRDYLESFGNHEASRAMAFAALKFFYHDLMRMPLTVFSLRRRRNKRLPPVLSSREVMLLLAAVQNPRHRLMLSLLYGSGLRVGELVALNIGDIDLDSARVHVRQGKGGKDRYAVLPRSLIPELTAMLGDRPGSDPVFITRSNTRYRIRTVQAVFEKALRRTDIRKRASCHTLRYANLLSFLTFFRKMFLESKLV